MKKNINKKNTKEKNNAKKIENSGSFETDFYKILYIVLGVVCVFCLFYLLTVFITNKNSDSSNKKDEDEVSISLDSTIVGRSLSMSEEKYYVLYYETKNEEVADKYNPIVSSYNYKNDEGHIKLYTVDMSDAINKSYASTESNSAPKVESEIKINGTTLILVEKGNVVDYIEDQNRIEELLK